MDAMNSAGERTLIGRIVGAAGRTDNVGVAVRFSYRPVGGETVTLSTVSDEDGEFVFDLPTEPIAAARVGAEIEGANVVDLEPDGSPLEPGDVVLMVDDFVKSHIRYLPG